MMERTTVRLPKDLMRQAKRKAAEQGRSLTSLMEEVVRRIVSEDRQRPKSRKLVPVSKAAGGLMPGIDISNSAALQEMDDLEYVERMKHFK